MTVTGRKKLSTNPTEQDTKAHQNSLPKFQDMAGKTTFCLIQPCPGSCRYPFATLRASWASIFTDFRVGVLPGMAWMKSRAASAPVSWITTLDKSFINGPCSIAMSKYHMVGQFQSSGEIPLNFHCKLCLPGIPFESDIYIYICIPCIHFIYLPWLDGQLHMYVSRYIYIYIPTL